MVSVDKNIFIFDSILLDFSIFWKSTFLITKSSMSPFCYSWKARLKKGYYLLYFEADKTAVSKTGSFVQYSSGGGDDDKESEE